MKLSPKQQVNIKFGIIVALTVVLALAYRLFVSAANGPALLNPSFEEGWHIQGRPEKVIPDYWTLQDVEGSHPWCPTAPCHAPEVKPNEEYVTDGQYSIRTFTTFSHGLYGIYQEIEVEPGSWWTFACETRVDSNPPGELAAFVGIQPWAGSLFDRQMVWGKETQKIGEWVSVSVTAQAYGSKIKVAMGGNNKWATKDNTLWWDACTLAPAEGPAQPTPTPYPTLTPWPTPEPCPTHIPGGECDYDAIRQIVREELDKTTLGSVE